MYIIGTAGPNIKEKSLIKGIIDNGVNILRFNFAHGSEDEFLEFLKATRDIDQNVKIILDLSGTKIRISNKFEYIYKVYDGEEVYFCGEDKYNITKNNLKNKKLIPLNIDNKLLNKKKYKEIAIKDNTMQFKIIGRSDKFIRAITIKGGIIRKGKGCNIKELDRSNLELSENDKKAILWGIENKVDIICQSFVEDKQDIEEVRSFLSENAIEKYKPIIWGKIETLKGVNNIKSIVKEVDGIIIGRGDLIPETSIEDTPIYEQMVIDEVLKEGKKDIIIATHIFNSMKNGRRPSISEVESVYNFIKLGVTGFLLAGETSVGKTPLKTVKFLKSLIDKYINK
ncbi:MAG: pyruvate kinase [Clostridium butyricum]|nr:pyruvate kinase [Clostridium butyricum]